MKKNKILTVITSIILICCCFIPLFFLRDGGKVQYDVLYFGDSIIAGREGEKGIVDLLSEKSGLTVYNAAFGGMTMSTFVNSEYTSNMYTLFSMAGLSACIRDRDFSLVSMASRKENDVVPLYWSEKADGFLYIDYDKVKYVIIEYGTNDYMVGVPLYNDKNPYDTATFAGALRSSIRNIKKGMPNAKIIIETPIFSAVMGNSDNVNTGSGTMLDYIKIEKEIADQEKVFLFDAHDLSGINQSNFYDYLYDNLHTNSVGDKILSDCLCDFLEDME